MASSVPRPKNKRFMLLVVIPLLSCILSSVIGIIFGQIGNLIFAIFHFLNLLNFLWVIFDDLYFVLPD